MKASDLVMAGTKVLVHDKTHGCPLDHVFRRTGHEYPKRSPFHAWIRGVEDGYRQIYTIVYKENGRGGDYYNRRDFKTTSEMEMFSNEDFEL